MSEVEVVECGCGRVVGGYIPSRGDGSMLRPRKHLDRRGLSCPHRFRLYDRADPAILPAPTPDDAEGKG